MNSPFVEVPVGKSQLCWVKVGLCPQNTPFYLSALKFMNYKTIYGINVINSLDSGVFGASVNYEGVVYDSITANIGATFPNLFSISLADHKGNIMVSEMPLRDLYPMERWAGLYRPFNDLVINWEKSYLMRYTTSAFLTANSALPIELFYK